MTVYGAELRLNEACHLRMEDVEGSRGMLRINQGSRGPWGGAETDCDEGAARRVSEP